MCAKERTKPHKEQNARVFQRLNFDFCLLQVGEDPLFPPPMPLVALQ